MKRAAVAVLLIVSMVGCFPHNARHRRYAQLGEGAAIVTGIVLSAVANTSADCDEMAMAGIDDSGCHDKAKWLGATGMILLVGGLLGFVATVSTAENEAKPKPVIVREAPKTTTDSAAATAPAPAPAPAETPAAPAPEATGSAAPAPQH